MITVEEKERKNHEEEEGKATEADIVLLVEGCKLENYVFRLP